MNGALASFGTSCILHSFFSFAWLGGELAKHGGDFFFVFSVMILLDRGSYVGSPLRRHGTASKWQSRATLHYAAVGCPWAFSNALSWMRCPAQQMVGAYCFGFSLDGVHEKTNLYHHGVYGYTFIYTGKKHKSVNKGLGTALEHMESSDELSYTMEETKKKTGQWWIPMRLGYLWVWCCGI